MDNFSVSPRKHPQRSQRVDYHLLNDGSDEEAPPEDRVIKRFRSNIGSGGVELITPDESASQLNQLQSSPADPSQQSELNDDGQVVSHCDRRLVSDIGLYSGPRAGSDIGLCSGPRTGAYACGVG
ncbi:hypothetical protein V1507DRAFT_72217 [Lipomyces tetrasporus]